MNNYNPTNNRLNGTPNYSSSFMPYSYGSYPNGNIPYQNAFVPYSQNNGLNQAPQQINEMPIQVRFVTQKEAEGFIVFPNTTVLLIDKNNGMAHLKTANNLGESNTQIFSFVPYNANAPIETQSNSSNIDVNSFVTKTDLEKLNFATKDQLKAVLGKLEQLQKKIVGEDINGNK